MRSYIKATHTQTIYFYDVDNMEVVWHGNYMKYFEHARSKLLDVINYNYEQMQASGYTWPVVDFQIKYIKPLRLNQNILVEAHLIEFENRLRFVFKIYDAEKQTLMSKATSTQVAVKIGANTLEFESPDVLKEKIYKVLKCAK